MAYVANAWFARNPFAAKVAAVLQDCLLGNQPSLQLIKICHCWSFLEIPIQLMVDIAGSSAMVDFPRSFP